MSDHEILDMTVSSPVFSPPTVHSPPGYLFPIQTADPMPRVRASGSGARNSVS